MKTNKFLFVTLCFISVFIFSGCSNDKSIKVIYKIDHVKMTQYCPFNPEGSTIEGGEDSYAGTWIIENYDVAMDLKYQYGSLKNAEKQLQGKKKHFLYIQFDLNHDGKYDLQHDTQRRISDNGPGVKGKNRVDQATHDCDIAVIPNGTPARVVDLNP